MQGFPHLCADVTMSKKLTAMSRFVVLPVSSYPRASPTTLPCSRTHHDSG
jgi:hypothetical protein